MPLERGKSKQAFSHNVSTEMNAGKPQGQALAIAYNLKKRKKMADGGNIFDPIIDSAMDDVNKQIAAVDPKKTEDDYYSPPGTPRTAFAEGGRVDRIMQKRNRPDMRDHEMDEYDPTEDPDRKPNTEAITEDDRDLNQHGEREQGPYGTMMAEGGQIDEMDMVGRIMKQRQQHFSEGGKVANEDHGPDEDELAGFSPNEFDDLALRDDLEFSYTGSNSGDDLGDAREDSDRKDIISRIMRSRAKKDRLPNPR